MISRDVDSWQTSFIAIVATLGAVIANERVTWQMEEIKQLTSRIDALEQGTADMKDKIPAQLVADLMRSANGQATGDERRDAYSRFIEFVTGGRTTKEEVREKMRARDGK